MKLFSKVSLTTNTTHTGYTILEFMALLGIASVLLLSLLALMNSKQAPLTQERPILCRDSYWRAQQKADEIWMFGESKDVPCTTQ
ncbi:hypothetical protein [Aliidiomarina quisquiliarum]|uniref:hypothetical protein n=1 Tax=Aliidiomarina quisquiliarum TaxID=2938947 RepID=UPI00208E10AC|nr:hypothetical protein [Aliidiomarina quisquiliarum]MCO4322020.1 hypothetical protein [Aliidiomarina quisquiliarum]